MKHRLRRLEVAVYALLILHVLSLGVDLTVGQLATLTTLIKLILGG